jgi:hypothetical protein
MLLGIPGLMIAGAALILFGLFSPLLIPVAVRSSARTAGETLPSRRAAGFVFGSPVRSGEVPKSEEIARHLDEARRLLADDDDPNASKDPGKG